MLPLTLRGITNIADGGGVVKQFEEEFSDVTGSRFALAMNSGTAALHSAYFAVGVGPGTEVIVPSYTWHASVTPVLLCGGVPVFCEIDPRTLTADPDDIERRITDRTRAICVVHIWGNPARMDRIVEIAERHSLAVIEDCSHAHGAKFGGRHVGTWGHVGCYSLNGAKPVDGGEAGVAVTNDPGLYDHMLLLGHSGRLEVGQKAASFDLGDTSLGLKYRPHVAALCLARASLRRLDQQNARASRIWQLLREELRDTPALRPIEELPEATRGGFYGFVFEYCGEDLGGPGPEDFVAAVAAEGAPLVYNPEHYPVLHTQALFTRMDRRRLGGGCFDPTRPWEENLWSGSLPVTERISRRLVSFPGRLLWGMSEDYARGCARALKKVVRARVPTDSVAETAGGAGEAPLASTGS
jgi:dTDP-4-amino-4,6-dideoxygalactose transaminase